MSTPNETQPRKAEPLIRKGEWSWSLLYLVPLAVLAAVALGIFLAIWWVCSVTLSLLIFTFGTKSQKQRRTAFLRSREEDEYHGRYHW